MTLKKKLLVAPVVAFGVVVGSSTAAFAHHCINESRSAQGNAGAGQSNGWFTLTLEDLFADAVANNEDFGLPPADVGDIPDMVEAAQEAGVPDSFVVLAHSTAANGLQKKDDPKQASDGRGIDFFDSVYIEDLIGAYLSVATPAP